MAHKLITGLLDLLFPPKCAFCMKLLTAGEVGFCNSCQGALPWLEGAAAEQKGEFFSLCVSPLRYEKAVRDCLRRYKFSGRQGYAHAYGTLLAQCVTDHLSQRYDLISWVPLSDKRRRERGYDQAFLLAEATARALGQSATATLRKNRNSPAQSGLTGEAERRANVMGAYQVLDLEQIAHRRVLLVDDIITTGSTLSECARVLRTGGADDVVCATLARAH